MTKFSAGPRLPVLMVQNVKSELRYLLKLVHLQNDRLRHPPLWSHSLFLPLLGQSPATTILWPRAVHTSTLSPPQLTVPSFRSIVGAPRATSFLPALNSAGRVKAGWTDNTHCLSSHQPANTARGKVPSQAHQHGCTPWTTSRTVLLSSAVSPCLSDLLIRQPLRKLSKPSLSPSTSNMSHLSLTDFGFHFCFITYIRQDLSGFGATKSLPLQQPAPAEVFLFSWNNWVATPLKKTAFHPGLVLKTQSGLWGQPRGGHWWPQESHMERAGKQQDSYGQLIWEIWLQREAIMYCFLPKFRLWTITFILPSFLSIQSLVPRPVSSAQ